MAEVKWIKITTNIFDDEKIKLIDTMPDRDTLLVIWFKLLTLAGKTNDGGEVYIIKEMPTTDEMLATIFNRPLNTVRLALETFQRFNMIDVKDHVNVVNWEKHQNIEGLDKLKEQNRKRQATYRNKQKSIEKKSNVTVTLSNDTDKIREDKNRIDIEEDKDKEIDKNNPSSSFNEKELEEKKDNIEKFIYTLEKQFSTSIERIASDNIKRLCVLNNVNPLEAYENSDYLKGLADKKPTLSMFFKEKTYQNMKMKVYENKYNQKELVSYTEEERRKKDEEQNEVDRLLGL